MTRVQGKATGIVARSGGKAGTAGTWQRTLLPLMALGLFVAFALPVVGQSVVSDAEAGTDSVTGNAALPAAGAQAGNAALPAAGAQAGNAALPAADPRLEMVAQRRRRHGKTRAAAAPAISRAQMELAREMVDDSYGLGKRLELRQRVALMERLLYTMRPEVMAEEKKVWAEELFGLALELPGGAAAGVEDAATTAASAAGAGASDPTFANGQTGATRDNAIATAAARIAVYDSERALELLDTLPSQGGKRKDARTMASRLVFAIYMQHHGAAGAQTLLAHAKKWGEHGGFPYEASAAALARLRTDEDAAEDFFRQELAVFARGQEGVFGVGEFAGLLDRAVALEAISDESAEEAGREVVAQLSKLAGMAPANVAAGNEAGGFDPAALTDDEQRQVAEAMNDVRLSAPKAYLKAAKDWPGLLSVRETRVAMLPTGALAGPAFDLGLQEAFAELAEAMRERSGPESLHEVIAKGLRLVNARYKAGECGDCLRPDAQSWALVSLAAYASPMTIATQLKEIEAPFWRAYFLAIAAQQVGEPTRVADPTARRVLGKEEAEPE